MPPRRIPWLTEPKPKTPNSNSHSTSSPASSKRKRDTSPPSDQDLVDSDLNPIGETTPPRRSRPRLANQSRSPSTSPPPAPPNVEYMREGYGLDDSWMMVEDEFFATAQLYTQHLHHAAYTLHKRKAEARGQKLLQTMARPTDGSTQRNGMIVEREEREKAIKKALGPGQDQEDEEDDDGEITDPLLGALMNDPRRMGRALEGVGKAKSESRAAKGFLRSPEKPKKTFGLNDKGNREGEAAGEDATDAESDDLDGPAPKAKRPSMPFQKDGHKSNTTTTNPRQKTDLFKKLAASDEEETYRPAAKTNGADKERTRRVDDRKQSYNTDPKRANGMSSKSPFTSSTIDDFEPVSEPKARQGTPDYLKRRRQRKEEEEKRKAKEKKAAVEIPTFLF
ncbi:hypothetical protein Q7P37_006815 [Cladosporium fusiforme]